MKCRRHPTIDRLKGKAYCTFCEDWSRHSSVVESDARKFERNVFARHIDRNARGDYGSPGSYKRLLKRHGLTDDVSLKELRDRAVDTAYRERVREQKIHTFTDGLRRDALQSADAGRPVQTERQRALWNRLERMGKR